MNLFKSASSLYIIETPFVSVIGSAHAPIGSLSMPKEDREWLSASAQTYMLKNTLYPSHEQLDWEEFVYEKYSN